MNTYHNTGHCSDPLAGADRDEVHGFTETHRDTCESAASNPPEGGATIIEDTESSDGIRRMTRHPRKQARVRAEGRILVTKIV